MMEYQVEGALALLPQSISARTAVWVAAWNVFGSTDNAVEWVTLHDDVLP